MVSKELSAKIATIVNRKLQKQHEEKINRSIASMFANIDVVIEDMLMPIIKKIIFAHAGLDSTWTDRIELRGNDSTPLTVAVKQKAEAFAREILPDLDLKLTQRELASIRSSARERFHNSVGYAVNRKVDEIVARLAEEQAQQAVDAIFSKVEEKQQEDSE